VAVGQTATSARAGSRAEVVVTMVAAVVLGSAGGFGRLRKTLVGLMTLLAQHLPAATAESASFGA